MLGPVRARRQQARVFLPMVAVVILASACGPSSSPSEEGRAVTAQTLTAPPTLPLPGEAPPAPAAETPTTTLPTEPLPEPSFIPVDSYANEPVTEIGTMQIPAIGLDHRIFQGVTLNNIDQGPSHWPGTALPGQRGNTVFAGHRTTRTFPFRRIDELVPGDEVIFRVNGVRSVYKVTGSLIVDPDALWIADQTPDATGTLYACHPPGWATYRYVVKMALASTGRDV